MHIILHQFKRDLSAQRGLLIAWSLLMTAQMIFTITGLGGVFYASYASPMTSQLLMLMGAGAAFGTVLIPAAIALADPPTELSAQWRTIPIRPWQLVTAKLLTILFGVALPLMLTQILTLIFTGAQSWSWYVILDCASNLPSWMLLGFSFGALAGNWKRFTVGIAALLVGNAMLVFVINTWTGNHITPTTSVALLLIERGIENVLTNNLFLIGSIAAILLRYFTRLRGELIVIVFLLGVPATVFVSPALLESLVPIYKPAKTPGVQDCSVEYDLPKQIFVVTNNTSIRWQGHVPYSSIKVQGANPPHFVLPSRLDTFVWAVNDARDFFTAIGQDWVRLPGPDSNAPWLRDPRHLMERHLTLSNAIPGFEIINPPYEPGEGFNLFDVEEHMALRSQGTNISLSANLTARVGTFFPTGELPLAIGSTISSNGTTVRVAAWLPDAGNQTQIKVNTRHVQFATEDDSYSNRKYLDPRRNPTELRYFLVNEARGEACLPRTPRSSSTKHSHPLAFQSTVLSFSSADGPTNDLPIASAWLKDAKLHVFRAVLGSQLLRTNQMDNVDIYQIPRKSLPKKIELKYR